MTNTHYLLTLSYDGTAYYGFQANGEHPTIEGVLKKVLATVFQRDIRIDAASRTDRGVHAEGQLVAFTAPYFAKGNRQLHLSLNQLLPKDIRILSIEETPSRVLPSIGVKEKTYEYLIDIAPFHSPFSRFVAWHVPYSLDIDKMILATEHLIGTHDFAAFTNVGAPNYEHTERTIYDITIEQDLPLLRISVRGNAFLYRMVRNIVGTLVQIGKGEISPSAIGEILESKDRRKAGVAAPAHGLVLKQISR